MMPAKTVSTAAAMGETMAPIGRRVGSEPVSTTGNAMLRIVATSQTVSVATASPIQMGRRDALPRSLPIAHRNPPVATRPHSQVVKAATGRCSCSLPDTMSGARTLINTTAVQIPASPPTLHTIQEPSAVAVRSFEPDVCMSLTDPSLGFREHGAVVFDGDPQLDELGPAVSEDCVDELADDREPLERWGGVADAVGWLSIDRLLSEGSGLSIRGGTRSAELRAGSRDRHLGHLDRLAALGEIAG